MKLERGERRGRLVTVLPPPTKHRTQSPWFHPKAGLPTAAWSEATFAAWLVSRGKSGMLLLIPVNRALSTKRRESDDAIVERHDNHHSIIRYAVLWGSFRTRLRWSS